MATFIPWNSQPLEDWASKHAAGRVMKLDGLPMHYVEKGSGKPLILIHGFFFDSNLWNKNIDALAEQYKVYAIDLWGFGYSSREPLDYNYDLYARQLLLFMDALNIERASLAGQSMGGGTIIKFAVSHPDRVEKIVLVNAAGMPNPLPFLGKLSNLPMLGEFLFGMNNDFIRKFTLRSNFIYNKGLITDDFYAALTRFHKIEGSLEVMLSITRNQFFDTLSEEIKKLGTMDIPILITWGRQERSIRLSIGKAMARLLKGSQFEVLDPAGHCSNVDQYEPFNQLVLKFLGSETNEG